MFLLVVKIVHLIGRTDLFKISNLVLVGQAIVTSLYNSLEGTERERERERERPVGREQGFIQVMAREITLPT